jgi:glyoxylase-like metal-dependent hydrolase (beta-lactamase superfamily II)
MEEIVPRLQATKPLDLGFGRVPLQARTFVLQRPSGNIAVYGPAPLQPELDAVLAVGGVTAQYVNHVHELSAPAPLVREALGATLHVHAADADGQPVDATFDARHLVGDDFEVIPTPGHTPGATAFLWRTPEHRVLFTGDTVFVRDGEWVAAFLDDVSDRPSYLDSLELLASLEFDVLAPGIAPVGQPPVAFTDPQGARERLGQIADRLRTGRDQ